MGERASDEAAPPGAALGVVLAGGRGRRLGGAKAVAELGGRPLISYPLAALAAAGLEPLVVAKAGSELPPLECRLLREPAEPRHPLCGIVAALRAAPGRPLVVLACDMPLVAPALLVGLAAASQPLVLPHVDGETQAFPARVAAALLPALERALERGEPLRRSLDSLQPHRIGEHELRRFGDPRDFCFSVNDAEDLRRAERLIRA